MTFHRKMLLAVGLLWAGALVATLQGARDGAVACMAMEGLIGIWALVM